MSKMIVGNLNRDASLDGGAMASIGGGSSFPAEPDHGPGGPGPLPSPHMPIDVEKLKEEILSAWGPLPWGPVPVPSTDPLGGTY